MEQLDRAQLRRSLDVLTQLAQLRRLDEYPARVAALLGELVACDIASYTAVDPATGRVTIAAYPADTIFDGAQEVFARYAGQNPLVEHFALTGDGRALRISDFITHRQLHRTELYEHIYRPIEVEYQMAITLPSPTRDLGRPREMIGLTLSRSRRDFTARECQLLDVVRPHLSATLERLHEVALMSALSEGEDDQGAWVALIDGAGHVALSSRAAASHLGLIPGDPLPKALCDWVLQMRPALCGGAFASGVRSGVVELGGTRVLAQLRRAVHGELDSLRVRPLGEPPGPSQLRALGLTARQAEVLALVLRGEPSPRIAYILDLSPRTIEKHLEAVYGRLGVSGRAQAIVHALQAFPTS